MLAQSNARIVQRRSAKLEAEEEDPGLLLAAMRAQLAQQQMMHGQQIASQRVRLASALQKL